MNTLIAIIGAVGWVINKIHGVKSASDAKAKLEAAAKRAADVAAAMATASSVMLQLVLTAAPDETAASLIVKCKGAAAIQLAKIGIYEADVAPYQPLIDKAISAAVTKWVELHPSPQGLTLPIHAALGS